MAALNSSLSGPHTRPQSPGGPGRSIVPEHHIGTCRYTKQGLTLIADFEP